MHVLVFVRFPRPEGWDVETLYAKYKETTVLYTDIDGLLRKDYHYNPETDIGGGMYLWDDEEKARAFHQGPWMERLLANYGSEPEIDWLQIPMTTDGINHSVAVYL